MRGLLGILRSQCIWATNIHYLNDVKEFVHAIDLAKYEIHQLRNSISSDKYTALDKIDSILESVSKINIFVCSFSENGDLLSQWRGYCKGGSGFSIGFEYPQIKNTIEKKNFNLVPCIYDPQHQISIIKELINNTFQEFSSLPEQSLKERDIYLKTLESKFIGNFIKIAPVLKHYSFSEEKEWRLVSRPISIYDPQIRYREGKVLIPYYEFQLVEDNDIFCFSEIIVGPASDNELSMNALSNMLIAMKNVKKGQIRCSHIPYRAWL
jgi:hypothetical protein